MDLDEDLRQLLAVIAAAEKRAVVKAMAGLWTAEDDQYLGELYEQRVRLYHALSAARQL